MIPEGLHFVPNPNSSQVCSVLCQHSPTPTLFCPSRPGLGVAPPVADFYIVSPILLLGFQLFQHICNYFPELNSFYWSTWLGLRFPVWTLTETMTYLISLFISN